MFRMHLIRGMRVVFGFGLLAMLSATHAKASQEISEMQWLIREAERGVADAQLLLGRIFDTGDGVPENDLEAFKWYRAAAEQGLATAQYLLAQMYQNGIGNLEEDPVQAAKWYAKAAEQSDVNSQFSLSVLHANGLGVKQDDLKAYMWANLAAAAGSTLAVWQKDVLSSRMTKEQIAEAQKLSAEWLQRQEARLSVSSGR